MRSLVKVLFTIYFGMPWAYSQSVRINVTDHQPDEFTVAVNPKQPRYVVAAANINHCYLSDDGGRSFSEKIVKSSMGVYGDPVLRYDNEGTLYFLHLARNSSYQAQSADFYQSLDRIVVQISSDNGKTFSDGYSVGYTAGRMQDKPWISFGPDGRIYISWTEFDVYGSQDTGCHSRIRVFSASKDWKDTLTTTISDCSGNCLDEDETVEGATIAFGPQGRVYCCWAGHKKIYLDFSDNHGKSWGVDRVVASQACGWTQEVPHIYRSNGLPFLQNDSMGNLFLAYAQCCLDLPCSQTILMSSQDGGITWERILYNDSLRSIAGKYSFSPNMAYNRQSQRLGVVYYSNEMSPSGRFGRVNGLIYNPATREVQVRRISGIFPFPGKEVFFGDYLDVCAFGDGFKAVWNQPDSMEMSGYTNVFGLQNNQDEDSMACFFEMAGGDPYITVFLESKQMGLSAPRIRLVNSSKGSMGKVKLKSSQCSVQRIGAGNLCGYEWKFQIRGIPLMQPTDVCVDFKNDSRKFSGLLMKGI